MSPTTVSTKISSVQFSRSVLSNSLHPPGLRHARLPCPSPTPGAYSNSCLLSQWCHPTISSSVQERTRKKSLRREALLVKWFQGKWKQLALRQRSQGTRSGPFDWLIHCISLDFSFLESSDLNISNVSCHFNAITLKKETEEQGKG